MKRYLLLLVFSFYFLPSFAQVAGINSLAILDLSPSARSAGVGFDFLSVADSDINLTLGNPSLISSGISDQLALNYVGLFAGGTYGSVVYGHEFRHFGAFTFGLQFANYGRFSGYDETDRQVSDFYAADYLFCIGWGRAVDNNLYIGANCKPILSQYDSYNAVALAFDLAASYISDNRRFAATLMGRNIGAQLLTFNGTAEHIPYELAFAASYKLADAPFRLMVELNDLQTWDLRYEDPLNPSSTTDPFTGEVTRQSDMVQILDNLGRHVNVGLEVNIRRVFLFRLGYSYRQMVEMRAAETLNLSGISFGFGIRVKGFEICYSRNNYHLTQAPNFISVTTDLKRFFR